MKRIRKLTTPDRRWATWSRFLNPREQLILKLRFGLGGESPRTLIEVSQVLGVSKERVRQIQDRALAKLRASSAGDAFLEPIEAGAPAAVVVETEGARWNVAATKYSR